VNTFLKHSEQYTFKIGVKELGWRRRTTLNKNEQLIHPADYVRINIAEKLSPDVFLQFAVAVCNDRIARLSLPSAPAPGDLRTLLPGLDEEEEAELLDDEGDGLARQAAARLAADAGPTAPLLGKLSLLEKYFLVWWADAHGQQLQQASAEWAADPDSRTRYDNYKHALLYTLRRRKRGIQKYYSGWEVFGLLAAGNIRYFLELVDNSLLLHLESGGTLQHPIPPRLQTLAAQDVGKKNLAELEGLSVHGAQLTKLLLGLGRVFQTLAARPEGHAPEVNQFHLREDVDDDGSELTEDATRLLSAAVMHLAFVRFLGSKLADETDTRAYDYMIHPIFTPFFVFSYRRKRKLVLSAEQLLGLVRSPKTAIRAILTAQNRLDDEPLPEQLCLFAKYYGVDS
jgi:hypothetical protein